MPVNTGCSHKSEIHHPAIIFLTHLSSDVVWCFSSSQCLSGEQSHSISSALIKYCTILVGSVRVRFTLCRGQRFTLYRCLMPPEQWSVTMQLTSYTPVRRGKRIWTHEWMCLWCSSLGTLMWFIWGKLYFQFLMTSSSCYC